MTDGNQSPIDYDAETSESQLERLEPPPEVDEPPEMPSRVGHYAVKSFIAAGGMSAVYVAVQEQPHRTVALKLMKGGITSRSALRRFEFESQILGRLHHPNIAQVYEAGTHDDATGPRQRLALFAKVCAAVHHGHQKGIIHRDLKPGNILVDSAGEPKVIDFGVARATDSDMAVTALQTDVGQLIGTPQYMSPEQCEADPSDLDIRSDVYALGLILYELLCDHRPYDLSKVPMLEAARVIREQTPTRLSTVNRTLRGDIETITFKALEKDRDRRYQSAADLQRDIERYLNNEPIEARPPSLAYQVRVFARRNRAVFSAAVAAFVVLVVGVIGTTAGMIRANAEAERARNAEQAASRSEQRSIEEAERATTAEAAAVAEAQRAEFQTYAANLFAADASLRMNEPAPARERLERCPPQLRHWEWKHLYARLDRSLGVLRGHENEVWIASFSPDGTRLVTASYDHTARVWGAASGKEVAVLRGHEGAVEFASFDPDGTRIVTAGLDTTVRVWDAETGAERFVLRDHQGEIRAASFSPDGARIITGSHDGTARVWDAASGEQVLLLRGHDRGISSASFSPDGTRIVTASYDATARVWDAASGETIAVLQGHDEALWTASFSPDGTRILTASWDQTARVWDIATGEVIAVMRGHVDTIWTAAFSPDGARVVTASRDATARVWNVETGEGP
ncbi:MAG: protein kinase domain-containing protein, partial [Planctomycetota bacterium]